MESKFKEGAVVDIFWNDGQQMKNVIIVRVPQNQGEGWEFKTSERYIFQNPLSSNFDGMVLKREANIDPETRIPFKKPTTVGRRGY